VLDGQAREPIAIRWLKRFAMNSVPRDRVIDIVRKGVTNAANGRKVAIIGAGPAGLAAAFDLARAGHPLTVFEGIPEYRLPRERLDDDIAVIQALGVDIRCNTWVGKDVTLEQDYDAVIVAYGGK
jgi:glutamate synthase (NADPH/NADH) small chain